MTSLGKRLLKSARQARKIARGEANPKTYKIVIPANIDVRGIRTKMGYTQEEFAARFSITVARLRDWEQGRSAPDAPARAYLTVIEKEPDAVQRALSSPAAKHAQGVT